MKAQKGLAPILIVILIALAVGGYLVYQNQSKSVSPVKTDTSPAPTGATETANPDSIGANWKTYTNTQHGYSLKYPTTWDKLECDSKSLLIAILGPEVASTCATDAPGPLRITVTDGIKDPMGNIDPSFNVVDKNTINIDGETGEWVYVEKVKPSPGADKIILVAVIHAGKTYTFNLSEVEEQENLNQILSTFKFIPQ